MRNGSKQIISQVFPYSTLPTSSHKSKIRLRSPRWSISQRIPFINICCQNRQSISRVWDKAVTYVDPSANLLSRSSPSYQRRWSDGYPSYRYDLVVAAHSHFRALSPLTNSLYPHLRR